MTDNRLEKVRAEVKKLSGNPYYMMAVKDVLEILDMQEEPVSEDLEKAANAYISNENNYSHSRTDTFKAGAKWQKEKDQSTIELAEDHAMLAGIIKGTEHTIGEIRNILNKVAYKNDSLDVNGDYCEQPYVELDNEFKKLLKEDEL